MSPSPPAFFTSTYTLIYNQVEKRDKLGNMTYDYLRGKEGVFVARLVVSSSADARSTSLVLGSSFHEDDIRPVQPKKAHQRVLKIILVLCRNILGIHSKLTVVSRDA
ncbi:hypothetical protein PGTUg99_021746 [Puccinia graminis f. sp. tritici]|uniref:Uncharacterized protein n=1 Tax=Puccinia graminis f. sp. tritici TaxID=56615 RepID=A0A5B0PHR1_PUCGR|nr:hypothetical protein PGTUg99_021746 [Puccinia graminis f. sp. tritici]